MPAMSAAAAANRPQIPCACGCGQQRPATDRFGRPRRYIGGHSRAPRRGGKCADPMWKAARSRKAAAANHRRWWAALEESCQKFPTKGAAFKAGYALGYDRAYRAWKKHLAALRRPAA